MLIFRLWLFASLSLVAVLFTPGAQAGELTLAVANSTCDAMKKVGDAYRAKHSVRLTYVCKASGLLAKGLRGGALSAEIFVSADRGWMDFAIENDLVASDQVSSPWGNLLVVAVPAASPIRSLTWQELASDKVTTILIGDPSTAPFGRYAKDALENSGLWERVKDKIETRKNIELLAESLAAAKPSTVGILFATNLTDGLRKVSTVKSNLHKPIRYYMAPLKSAAGNGEAASFVKFLESDSAKDIFRAEGFDVGAP